MAMSESRLRQLWKDFTVPDWRYVVHQGQGECKDEERLQYKEHKNQNGIEVRTVDNFEVSQTILFGG